MGLLVQGVWQDRWYETEKNKGEFIREAAKLRHWVTPQGAAGPSGEGGFKAETGRYHLYVSHACPWANRTMIMRVLKGLEKVITVSVVSPYMGEQGWTFERGSGSSGDALYALDYLHQIYTRNDASHSGRVTVPVLWDKQQQRIVSNESSEIMRMFNSAFSAFSDNTYDFYPVVLRDDIEATNARVYADINNGVYRAGFATTQLAYDTAYERLFRTLDELEQRLGEQRYLLGARITEADWRLFTTLVRFDVVYVGHFKCNRNRIADFPNLSQYLRELYQWQGVAATIHFDHIKTHYYASHASINPTAIVPRGPVLDLQAPHNRNRL